MEVVRLSERDGVLRYRVVREALTPGVHPDDQAVCMAGLTLCTPGALLHSTSWREENGTIVLTYAALPDPDPRSAETRPVNVDAMVASSSPLVPSPCGLDLDAVAAHAGRHLALLLTADPVTIEAAVAAPRIWALIAKLPAGTARVLNRLAR